jgi:hypothetical protein
MPNPHGRRIQAGLALVALVGSAACDIPTEAPIIESQWRLPSESTEVRVADFLPSGVSVDASQSAFVVDVEGHSEQTTLGELCSDCAQINGLVAPKPAFEHIVEADATLPSDVASVVLASAFIDVTVRNGLSFDILRPGGEVGTLELSVFTLDGTPVTSTTISGLDRELPGDGGTLLETLTLQNVEIDGLQLVASIISPAGDETLIDVDHVVDVDVVLRNVTAASARTTLAGEEFELDPIDLDVQSLDSSIIDRIVSGRGIVAIVNELGVASDISIRVEGPTFEPIQKQLQVPATATSEVTVEFTSDELKQFLGQSDVQLAGTGVVTTPGTVLVTPDMTISIDLTLDATLRIGG